MPRLTKIYTRNGDLGLTSLGNDQQVPKNHPRVAAYGSVDELNSQLGVVLSMQPSALTRDTLQISQHLLFHIGTMLSFPPVKGKELPALPEVRPEHITVLEACIDEVNEITSPLKNFILPGGCPTAAALHLARTICRRTERELVSLMESEPVPEIVLRYLNRLSDVLFMLARYENLQADHPETLWDSRA